MRKLLLRLLLILTPIFTFSQTTNKIPIYAISGKIIDETTQLPLEDATIIFKSIDSNQIKFGGITNQKGHFSIDVSRGLYNAAVEFISYKTKKLNISTITKDLNIGTIAMELDTEYLNEVEITGEKKVLEFKHNKIVFNVDKDISAAGSTATDILNNIPSVSVDPDGSISLRGQNNVTVMINGKMSSMAGSEALKSLPAGAIENIELITNPGAKYKASSLSIINIILKKGKDIGLNGSFTATAGFKDYYGGLLTLNNKSKNVNFFTNTSYFQRNPVIISNSETEYINNGAATDFIRENSENNSKDNVFYGTIGFDFYLSPKTTLSTSVNYSNIINNNTTKTKTDFFDISKILRSTNNRNYLRRLDNKIIEFVVDFQHNFKKEGQTLTSSMVFTNDEELYNNTVKNSDNLNFTNENYIENNIRKNKIVDLQFTNPISKTFTYSIGYQGEFGKIPFVYSGNSFDNTINYEENINGAYLELENQGEKFYIGAGIRAEFSETRVDNLNNTTSIEKRFKDLFPSIAMEYSFSDSQSIQFSYSKKIARPSYNQLQPFEQKFSETSSYVGNENLNPYYADASNLSYTFSGEKITISPTLYYNIYTDWWEFVTYETGEQINGAAKITTTPVNIGKVNYYGIDITTSYKPTKILNFTGSFNFLNMDQSGVFETVNLNNETIVKDFNQSIFNGYFSLLTQLKLPTLFDFQLNVGHDLISKGNFYTRKPRTYASIAINKDLFDKDASISLTVDDVFKSNKTDRDRFDANYFSNSVFENKYRTILFSFTYRFNQSKKDRKIDFEKKETKPTY